MKHSQNKNDNFMKKCIGKYKYEIYIGSKDKDNPIAIFDIKKVAKIISTIYSEYSVAFSLNYVSGGYATDKGAFIMENSLCLTCITDIDFNILLVLFNRIKILFNQESILISRTKVKEQLYE